MALHSMSPLCQRGRHCKNMYDTGAHSPLGCALVFGNGIGGSGSVQQEKMQCASCSAIKATELQDEPIAIRTMAPLDHHIRAYIAIVGEDPSKPQSPLSEGESHPPSPAPVQPDGGWGSSGTTSSTPRACSTKSRHGAPDQQVGIGITLGNPQE